VEDLREACQMADFKTELTALLNRHCADSDSNTPDYILAEYLAVCLANFNTAVRVRDAWHTNMSCTIAAAAAADVLPLDA